MRPERSLRLFLCTLGLGISLYLTLVHVAQGQVPLFCSTSGAINCEQVTTSPESAVGPFPVAALGIVWFLAMLLMAIPDGHLARFLSVARLIWAIGGLGFVLYLIYAELFLIGAICLWCTGVHVLVFGLFLLAVNSDVGVLLERTIEREEVARS